MSTQIMAYNLNLDLKNSFYDAKPKSNSNT